MKIEPELQKTYLAIINNSIGTKMFKNFYAKVNGRSKDIMANGGLSCAFFVSSICTISGLVKKVHGTVEGTIKDLKESGWTEAIKPSLGSVLVWEELKFGKNESHKHIGFYVGNEKAVSNSTNKKQPVKHGWTFGVKRGKPIRKIEMILDYNFKKVSQS